MGENIINDTMWLFLKMIIIKVRLGQLLLGSCGVFEVLTISTPFTNTKNKPHIYIQFLKDSS